MTEARQRHLGMDLSVLYRGPLTSCNYRCGYCPFAKRAETERQTLRDQQALVRFTEWIERESQHRWKVLFTPWGEALVRRWYREAAARLTHVAQVETVAFQTNLSGGIDWTRACRIDRLAFWATYHPTEAEAVAFVRKVERLRTRGARVCVGMVGVPEFLEEIAAMRRLLPDDVYLWINAQQPRRRPYTPEEVAVFSAIDPQFTLSARRQESLGKPCRTGELTFTVDGAGDMRRCHFVAEVIGNIHDPSWKQALCPRPCPNRFCDCFLGKSQLQADSLAPFFGTTLLERLPLPVNT
jgi:MoaA/NifB/PqqE/SkfB family radical SAM enzyme